MEENMQHLGTAKAVQHVGAHPFAPASEEFTGKRLARGNTEPQTVLAGRRQCVARKKHPVECGHAKEHCDAVLGDYLSHGFGGWHTVQQDGGGANRHREGKGVAQAVSEEKLGGGVDDVVLVYPKCGNRIEIGRFDGA